MNLSALINYIGFSSRKQTKEEKKMTMFPMASSSFSLYFNMQIPNCWERYVDGQLEAKQHRSLINVFNYPTRVVLLDVV